VSDALVLDGVCAGYGARDVLADLTLRACRGELLGVLGPNGCGKTTLLRVASGALRPRGGRVEVLGADLGAVRPREIARRVAVLSQDTAPAFAMAALEIVLLGRQPWHPAFAFETEEDLAAARAALSEVDAAALEDREFTTLSGGEKQRVLLARALCQGGELLLCDEPTSHLDLRQQAAVFHLLRKVRDAGRTVVVVTHDVQLAAEACDRVALFGPRGLIAVGSAAEVVTAPHLAESFGIEATVTSDATGRPLVVRHLGRRP
jgi:iron complex transport system ATP-binding protein